MMCSAPSFTVLSTDWPDLTLRSPLTGRALHWEGPHILAADEERWPVLDGIPFLRADRRDLADQALHALDRGDVDSALVLLLGDQDGWARTPPPDEDACRTVVRDRERISFRQAMDLLAFGPVGVYFAHRWSDPTFLSGLALAQAHWNTPDHVFELACGAGHYLREFIRCGAHATGADLVFAKLWLARHFVAPTARLICFDAARPWPISQTSAQMVFCHDAFYFLPEKPHVAMEMQRMADPTAGVIVVGHAHNRLVDNLSAGAPLSPADYAALFDAPLLYDDRELTASLVEQRAPHAVHPTALHTAPAIALACGPACPDAPRRTQGDLVQPVPGTTARAELRRNPLYAWHDNEWRIAWPSDRYATEYGSLATYPATLPADAQITDDLVRRRAFVDLPPQW